MASRISSSVEPEPPWKTKFDRMRTGAELLLDEVLRVLQDGRLQLDVAGLVDPVHVAEGRRDGEAVADLHQFLVGHRHVLGLGVELGAVDAGVVDAVLLAAGDAEFDLQRHAHRLMRSR
jgi:hypothetical protein